MRDSLLLLLNLTARLARETIYTLRISSCDSRTSYGLDASAVPVLQPFDRWHMRLLLVVLIARAALSTSQTRGVQCLQAREGKLGNEIRRGTQGGDTPKETVLRGSKAKTSHQRGFCGICSGGYDKVALRRYPGYRAKRRYLRASSAW